MLGRTRRAPRGRQAGKTCNREVRYSPGCTKARAAEAFYVEWRGREKWRGSASSARVGMVGELYNK